MSVNKTTMVNERELLGADNGRRNEAAALFTIGEMVTGSAQRKQWSLSQRVVCVGGSLIWRV